MKENCALQSMVLHPSYTTAEPLCLVNYKKQNRYFKMNLYSDLIFFATGKPHDNYVAKLT